MTSVANDYCPTFKSSIPVKKKEMREMIMKMKKEMSKERKENERNGIPYIAPCVSKMIENGVDEKY